MRRLWPLLVAVPAVSLPFLQLGAQQQLFTIGTPAELAQVRSVGLEHLRIIASQKGIDGPDDLQVSDTHVDRFSRAHTRVQQHFRGVPVFGGEAIAHLTAEGALFAETDAFIPDINVDTAARLTSDAAIEIATSDYGCSSCLTAAPKADLWILRDEGVDHLVYRVQLTRLDGTSDTAMPVRFVDAHGGYVVRSYDNLQTGTGNSLYSGTVSIGTSYSATYGVHILENLLRRVGTLDWVNTTGPSLYRLGDSDDIWDAPYIRPAVDAQFGAERFLDYLQSVHGRNGIDGGGGPQYFQAHDGGGMISSSVHYGTGYNNAFWNGLFMVYGDGDGSAFSPLVALDIAGHEMTHGVTQYTAGLVYQGESGALNESWSDVFGAMLERYVKGEGPNTWLLAEQAYTPGTPGDALRYMDNPHQASNKGFTADDDPDHYSERYTGTSDNGGIHINSGISNKAFYLLAHGGSHHLGGSMTGIGAGGAARIWYSALTSYMTSSTNFAGARTATLQAATAIFGGSSTQVAGVENAWCLVGIGACHLTLEAASVTPNSGNGMSRTFTLAYVDSLGVTTDLTAAQVRFAPTNAAAGSCTIQYRATTNQIRIQDDAGANGPWIAFGNGALSNSQCTVDLAFSTAVPSGANLTLTLHVTFASAFTGPKNIYMRAASATGADTGWPLRGTWRVGAAVDAISATPNSGTGMTQTFALTYSDEFGVAADLVAAQVRFATTNAAAGSCTIHYRATTGMVRLQDDAGVNGPWASFGSGTGTLANSQCTLDLALSSATPNSTNLTLNLSLTFAGTFRGAKNIYMRAASATGTDTGWPIRGTWAVPAPGPNAISVTPDTGSGVTQGFTLRSWETSGATNLTAARVRFGTSNAGPGTCTASYNAVAGTMSLLNDAGTAWTAGTMGIGTLSNSQCRLNLAGSYATPSGNELTVVLNITFAASFAGQKIVYMAAGSAGASTGWRQRGAWTIPIAVVSANSVTPNAGSGSTQAFTLTYADSFGAADLSARVRFGASNVGPGTCTARYNAATTVVELLNNAGTVWSAGTMGSGSLSNGQCTLNLASSSATANGTNLTIVLNVTFSASFAGQKQIYMLAASTSGVNSGWQQRGTWTATPPPPTTALFLDSQPGDYVGQGTERLFTPADGTFTVTSNFNGGVSFSVIGPQYSFWWYLDFSAADDEPLHAGSYGNATRFAFSEFSGLDVSGEGRGCNVLTGRFTVLEVAYDSNGNVQRFAVDFEEHCEDSDPGLFGALRYNSTISSGMTPFGGAYPSYKLRIATPANGHVSGAGFDCGDGGQTCEVVLQSPASLNLTASPSPGYAFSGWTESCHGARTIDVNVNSEEDCSALFTPINAGQPQTLLYWNSQQGDYIGQGDRDVYAPLNSHWTLDPFDGRIQLQVKSVAAPENSWWFLLFQAPTGQILAPGVYENATRFRSSTAGALDVFGNGRGCNEILGRFVVHELTVSGDVVTSLALDFEQHCENQTIPPRPLLGSIRYNSAVPISVSLALTFIGHGQVTIAPTNTICTYNCTETYALGASVQLTPTPDPGWSFVSWSGDIDCADGAIQMTAPTACRATFQQTPLAPERQSAP